MTATAANALYFFDCRVRETRMHFYRTFREPKLYRFAKKFEYDKIIERCTSNPKAAAREARFQHDYPPQQTSLHLVLEPLFLLGYPTALNDELREKRHCAAKALLDANKDAALLCCSLGTPPITMCCTDPFASLKDVDMLIRAHPKALLMPDVEGRLPLHYACINNRNSLEMIKMLIASCSEAAFAEDKLKRLALHYALMASAKSSQEQSSGLDMLAQKLVEHSSQAPTSTVPVVELLIKTNRKSTSAADKDGMTPLHHLCSYMTFSDAELPMELFSVLDLLVRANPLVANLPDTKGASPLSMLNALLRRYKLSINNDGEDDMSNCKEKVEALDMIMILCNQSDS